MKIEMLVLAIFLPIMVFAAEAKRPSLVHTEAVDKAQVRSLQNYVGTVTFEQSSNLASQSSGAVVSVQMQEGAKVAKGKKLAQLDTSILEANIEAQKAALQEVKVNLKKAQKDLKRYETLIKEDAVSQSVYDDNFFLVQSLQSKAASLEAGIKALKIELSKKSIKAPFDGIIISKNIELGDWANPGSVMAHIINPASAQIEVNLPQSTLENLHVKDTLSLSIGGKPYGGYVKAIIPKGDVSTRTFPVKIAFDKTPNDLLEGMAADVQLQSGADVEALIVPRDAVIKRFGQNVVFVDSQGSAMMIPVKVIGYTAGKTAVEGPGLSVGMRVVTKGNERIFPKSPIQDISGAK